MHALLIMKEVGHNWQKLSPKEKSIYEEAANLDKQRFQIETQKFEKEIENAINNKNLNQPIFDESDKNINEIDIQEEVESNSEDEHQSNDSEISQSIKDHPINNQKLFQVSSNTSRLKLAYCAFSKSVRISLMISILDTPKSQKW